MSHHPAGLVIDAFLCQYDVIVREFPAEFRAFDQTVEHDRQRLPSGVQRHPVRRGDVLCFIEEHQRCLLLDLHDGIVERSALYGDADALLQHTGLRRNRHFTRPEREKQREKSKNQIFFHKFKTS